MQDNQLSNYGAILSLLKEKIKVARVQAAELLNNKLLSVYWEIGSVVADQEKMMGWGSKVIDRLAADLKIEFPDMRGLSPRNLRYMRDFSQAYPRFVILQQLAALNEVAENQIDTILQQAAAKLPWGHHQVILDRVKNVDERCFYIGKCAENQWSRNVLVHQIESNLHMRQGALTHNFQDTLSAYESELTQQVFKDPYQLDFIMLSEKAKERDLENALTSNITNFLLELGDGFAFIGRQKRFEVGDQEFFVDLLFYHTRLRRYIIIELKIGDFEPEFVSKMNLYLGLADDRLKGEYDEASIGLILCKTRNKVVAEYALRDSGKPIGIAQYNIASVLPDDIKGELPTIKELEENLGTHIAFPQNPIDEKLSRIKQILSESSFEEVKETQNKQVTKRVFEEIVLPLKQSISREIEEKIASLFTDPDIILYVGRTGYKEEENAIQHLRGELLYECSRFSIAVQLNGFKMAGVNTFFISQGMDIILDKYRYSISIHNTQKKTTNLYHQKLSEKEFSNLVTVLIEKVLDGISENLSKLNTQNDA